MADSKSTRSHKRHTSRLLRFPEVAGKTIHAVELDPEGLAIVVIFRDETLLSFDLDPRLSVFPELSKRRRGEWRKLKRWPPVHTKSSMSKWL